MKTLEALEKVEKSVEKNCPELRLVKSIEVGQIVRQGDIYIHAVPNTHPKGKRLSTRQLALGTSKGSRHILESGTCYEGTKSPDNNVHLLGPTFSLRKRTLVTHPEHAHVSLPPGRYQVTHQMDPRTMERVRD